jgi:hypothetical protein
MNNKFLRFLGVAAILSLSVSCDKEEDVDSIVQVHKPNMTISVASVTNAVEGDIVPFTLTFDEPVGRDFNLYILRLNGSTASDLDSSVSELYPNTAYQQVVAIPAGTTTFIGGIEIELDDLKEDTEQLLLTIGDTRTYDVNFTPVDITINIENVVSEELKLDFHFNKTFYGNHGYSNSLCEIESALSATTYDVDFIVYDSMGNDLGIGDAQTTNCEESLTMNINDYANGIYDITAYLYTNADLDLAEIAFPLVDVPEFMIPITVDYFRSGAFKGLYTQEVTNQFTSNSPVGSENYVMSVEVYTDAADGVRKFRILNSAGSVSAEGKVAKKTYKHVRRNK